ncbi:energy-coupling factor transporter transmembrane protein EcfT [bacterium]|nr:energy-coupling factor transporter transmembrane protein EcfT [bacterium]
MNRSEENRLRGIDPRARLLAGVALMIGLLLLPWGAPLWLAGALLPVALMLVRPPFARLLTALFAISWMILLTLLVHAFSTPGHLIWEVPGVGWVMTVEGLERGGLFAGRLTAIVLLGAAVSLSINPLEGIRAVETLARPLGRIGVPVGSISLVFGLALRFVPTLFEEAKSLRNALLVRGWSPGKGMIGRVLAWIPLVIPLLASGLRRSDDIAETLVLRGYTPSGQRSSGRSLKWGWSESTLVAVTLLPFALFVVVQ